MQILLAHVNNFTINKNIVPWCIAAPVEFEAAGDWFSLTAKTAHGRRFFVRNRLLKDPNKAIILRSIIMYVRVQKSLKINNMRIPRLAKFVRLNTCIWALNLALRAYTFEFESAVLLHFIVKS